MNAVMRRSVVLAAGVALLACPGAWAFFPIGQFDTFEVLRHATWRFGAMDSNNDGDIGPDEGVEVLIEAGLRGFTPEEIEIVKEAIDVWRDVATSYAGIRIVGEYQDLILAGVPDGINSIQMEVPLDPSEIQVGVISDPAILGVTFIDYVTEDTTVTMNGITTQVSAGTILDADIVIDGILHRPLTPGGQPPFSLKDVLVHELGHFFGLDHTPNSTVSLEDINLIETASFKTRDATGQEVFVGLTPTMFPIYFTTRERVGGLPARAGAADLAPDDIAGISFLYPRGTLGDFFRIQHQARSQSRVDIPSFPLSGAVITAWIDHDNDPTTARQPIMSTMTGLYQPASKVTRAGNFDLFGLLKRIEVEGTVGQVEATYTLTLSPLSAIGFERMAPPPYLPADFQSIVGSAPPTEPLFLSETFNEFGNIIDLSNHDVGTPLKWDSGRRAIVSADTNRTLAEMLPNRGQPMFGDPNRTCPFNVIVGGVADTGALTKTLRSLRDNTLLESAVGAACVDLYYSLSPRLGGVLADNDGWLRWAAGLWQLGQAAVQLRLYLLLLAPPLYLLLRRVWRTRRARAAVAAGLLLILFAFGAVPAQASVGIPATTEDLVSYADAIVVGHVSSVESRWVQSARGKRIVTDIAVEVADTAKGRLNKGATLSFTVPGGQIGVVVTYASGLAKFAVGEEVLLYLAEAPSLGYVVVGGSRGKTPIGTEEKTGEKYVYAASDLQAVNLKRDAEALNRGKQQDASPRIPLDAYLDYLRGVAWAQEAEAARK
ncbi:MAG TPA: hypothetical protein PKI11_17200 [Candidatus Hydrogenedentes bacterium]|nr:hypothetical protein [Candidatus Hydrogenedentota bacterium]HNT86244.1 hypothetical protein [Candidatus Hydrogenedentota bacterium]